MNNFSSLNKSFESVKKAKNYSCEYSGYKGYLANAASRAFSQFNTQIQILSKILDMSKIRSIIYKLDAYNFQTRIAPFLYQENMLKQVDDG